VVRQPDVPGDALWIALATAGLDVDDVDDVDATASDLA